MILAGDTELANVLAAGGFERYYVCDVVVDGTRVLSDVRLESCELQSDGRSKIRNQGTATFLYSDEIGTSILPETMTSWLTPYATYLTISMRIAVGEFVRKVLRGTFKIVGVGDPDDQKVSYQSRLITVNSKVSLKLADAFAVTDRERFLAPSGPAALTSVWDELGRVSGLPLLRNVPDVAIARQVVYKESRLDALFDLADILAGVPYVNPAGQLTVQPNAWGAPTAPLTTGPDGTITRVKPDDLTDEGIYNQVVVRSFDSSQSVILATAQVTSGPLRYDGPFGRVPYFASSEWVTTSVDAQAYADALLPGVSSVPAVPFTIQCLPDPRREVGDVVSFTRDGETLAGRIDHLTLPGEGPMSLRVLVNRG